MTLAPRLFGPLLPPRCDPAASDGLLDSWPRAVSATPPPARTRCLVELVAVPTFLSPFRWRVIAHLSNAYEVHDVDLLEARFRRPPTDAEVVVADHVAVSERLDAGRSGPRPRRTLGRTFLGFARLPAARSIVDQTGTATVRWTDVRFMDAAPAAPNRGLQRDNLFTAVVRIGPDGQVLDERLGP